MLRCVIWVDITLYYSSDTYSSVGKRIGSDAGGLGFESQTGRVRGKSIPSLWRDKHPAIKGPRPPEHHAGHSIRTNKTPPGQTIQTSNIVYYIILYHIMVCYITLRYITGMQPCLWYCVYVHDTVHCVCARMIYDRMWLVWRYVCMCACALCNSMHIIIVSTMFATMGYDVMLRVVYNVMVYYVLDTTYVQPTTRCVHII